MALELKLYRFGTATNVFPRVGVRLVSARVGVRLVSV